MEFQSIPPAFHARKTKILSELSLPDAEYTDLSPKGSVDEGIRDLIRDINALPGLVTTSSCAGRISVFLEGRKKHQPQQQAEDNSQNQSQSQRQFASSGGKGAGRWLYVSHDPLIQSEDDSLHALFGMRPGDGKPPQQSNRTLRLVRFHFEPLVCID
jgi:tRNA wybutosine-synthesizing protein 3